MAQALNEKEDLLSDLHSQVLMDGRRPKHDQSTCWNEGQEVVCGEEHFFDINLRTASRQGHRT